MTIVLYNCVAEKDRLDKSSGLTQVTTLTGYLREKTNVTDPEIVIEQNNLPTFNYFFIQDFNRYYFLTDIISVSTGLWKISGHVDVLYSFRLSIQLLQVKASRNEYDYNLMLQDNNRLCQNKYHLTTTPITNDSADDMLFSLPSCNDASELVTALTERRFIINSLR